METRVPLQEKVSTGKAHLKEKFDAYVKFMPALVPVIYHEDHNQEDEPWRDLP